MLEMNNNVVMEDEFFSSSDDDMYNHGGISIMEEFSDDDESSFSDDFNILQNHDDDNRTTTTIHDRIKKKVYRDMMMVNKITPDKRDGTYNINRVTGRNVDLFAEKTHRGTLSVPHLSSKSIDQLMSIRNEQPYEVSGSIHFDPLGTNQIVKITKNTDGQDHSVEMEDNCVNCYHTHPDHPTYLSPPSGTDMIHAYALGGLHWVLAREGIYVYWKGKYAPLAEKYQNITDERSPVDDELRDLVIAESKLRDLLKYTRAALHLLGVHVLFIPWNRLTTNVITKL